MPLRKFAYIEGDANSFQLTERVPENQFEQRFFAIFSHL